MSFYLFFIYSVDKFHFFVNLKSISKTLLITPEIALLAASQ